MRFKRFAILGDRDFFNIESRGKKKSVGDANEDYSDHNEQKRSFEFCEKSAKSSARRAFLSCGSGGLEC